MANGKDKKRGHSPDKSPGKKKVRSSSVSDPSSSVASAGDPSSSVASAGDPSSSVASAGVSSGSGASSSGASSSASSSGAMPDGIRIKDRSNELEQGIASQIVPSFDKSTGELTIDRVQIIGRPERVFGSTMGDHTTAFAVQREGLEQQLKGKNIPDAFDVIQDFYDAARKLPGWELRDGLPTEHRQRLDRAQKTLEDLLNNKSNPSPAQTLSALQQAVGAYLEFRELMPLSTVNVAEKSQGTAGKGKGEASRINILLNHKPTNPQSKEVLKQAIVDLFDSSSAALAIVETDETILGEMLPGLDDKVPLQERMEKIIDQHIMSIEQGFPFISKDIINEAKDELKQALTIQVNNALIDDKVFLEDRIEGKNQQNQRDREERPLATKGEKKKIDERIANLEQDIKEDKQKIDKIDGYYKEAFGKEKDIDSATRITDKKKGNTEASVKKPVDEEYKSPLAMQISVAPNGKINAINSGGRSPSPFSGTMGAHTTAWTVHVDRIRKALKGKTPEEAIRTVETVLVPEAYKLKADREKLFKIDSLHNEKLTKAEENLKKFNTDLEGYKGDDSIVKLLKLQEYLGNLLTYINYIPGSTLEAADTGGKSEGRHRRVLMEFEGGVRKSKEELRKAIWGLLDLQKDLTDKQRSQLEEQHNKVIKATYPTAYEAVFEGKHSDRIDSSPLPGKKRQRPGAKSK